jgi:predicted SprT family Zn-dependent metalloprotease
MTTPMIQAEVRRLARLWRVPLASVDIRVTGRLTASWGRADALRGRVSISREVPRHLVKHVLGHELAHIAAFRLVGRAERHHGPTWERLVRKAGGDPKARLALPGKRLRASSRYLHSCPVCHFSRYGLRPVARWRCADCVQAGLSGQLTITQVRG